MITLADTLRESCIDLGLKMTHREEAIYHVASLLREDPRVNDWNAFYAGLQSKDPAVSVASDMQISIPHVRTNAVDTMVMAAGRSTKGLKEDDFAGEPIHFVFVIGVPVALAADYLRIIGALARIFKNAETEKRLREAKAPAEFLRILTAAEMKL